MKYFTKLANLTTEQLRAAITNATQVLKRSPTPENRKILTNLLHELKIRIPK